MSCLLKEGYRSRIKRRELTLDKMQETGSKRLPHLVRQRHVSAEEAVTNILYNTPPPSTEPYKR